MASEVRHRSTAKKKQKEEEEETVQAEEEDSEEDREEEEKPVKTKENIKAKTRTRAKKEEDQPVYASKTSKFISSLFSLTSLFSPSSSFIHCSRIHPLSFSFFFSFPLQLSTLLLL